MQKKKKVLL